MADTNETTADIIKKIRAEADYIEETARGSLKAGENYDGIAFTESDLESALDLAETKRKEADRLEASYKREVGVLKQRCAELNAEIAAKDAVIMRLNDAISEEQSRKMATTENSSAVGDAAKLRDALIKAVTMLAVCEWPDGTNMEGVEELRRDIDAALDIPPRNCDVDTAMEQGERFSAYCQAHKHPESECLPCPLFGQTSGYCELAWAQLPYEAKKGGAK